MKQLPCIKQHFQE